MALEGAHLDEKSRLDVRYVVEDGRRSHDGYSPLDEIALAAGDISSYNTHCVNCELYE